MEKPADARYPLHEIVARRWSPRAFAPHPIRRKALASLLEAARWAPSCHNDQPWSFFVATRDEPEVWDRLASCLSGGNSWARGAQVLMLTVARLRFAQNDRPNRHARHDVGLATATLVLQAEAMGLRAHQMAGFDVDRARELLRIPEGHEPMVMIAIGHPADPTTLSAEAAERERAPRTRKDLTSFVFAGTWGDPLEL
jgi:nitroreductase